MGFDCSFALFTAAWGTSHQGGDRNKEDSLASRCDKAVAVHYYCTLPTEEDCPIFSILVISETRTGKATLISNLLGCEVAPFSHTLESETLIVTPHQWRECQ